MRPEVSRGHHRSPEVLSTCTYPWSAVLSSWGCPSSVGRSSLEPWLLAEPTWAALEEGGGSLPVAGALAVWSPGSWLGPPGPP